MPVWLDNLVLKTADTTFAALPRPAPTWERVQRCRIIAHRGVYDNRTVLENTLPAFDALLDGGVWGLETDIRWTRDLQPVLSHDPDTTRLFGETARISDLSLPELRRRFPAIPTLEEAVQRYGARVHLMLEVKSEPYADPAYQDRRLNEILAPLTPGRDYHLMSLLPRLFEHLPSVPSSALIAVARVNVRAVSRFALTHRLAGFAGPYLFVPTGVIRRHLAAGQKVGVGFPRSRSSLYRELARGVEWIFSNDAIAMQRLLNDTRALLAR